MLFYVNSKTHVLFKKGFVMLRSDLFSRSIFYLTFLQLNVIKFD